MSNTAIVLAVGGTVAVGGVIGFVLWQRRSAARAVVAASPVAAPALISAPVAAAAAPQERKISVGEALAFLGGKALVEGSKLKALGPAGYAQQVAERMQKAS